MQCSYDSNTAEPPPSTFITRCHDNSTVTRLYREPSFAHLVETISGSPSPVCGTPRLALLNHLRHHFGDIQGLETAGGNLGAVIKLGMTRPYLLDATLAIAASNLRHCHQQRHLTITREFREMVASCRVAECFQQSLALRNFQYALALPLDQQGSDALLITSMMLNMLTFSMVESSDDECSSWVFSRDPDRLNWFSVNMGLKTLLLRTEEYRDGSILQGVFRASDDENGTFHGDKERLLDNVPEHWRKMCGLSSEECTVDDVFYEPIRILAVVRDMPISHEAIWLYLNFFGKLDFEFRDLLVDQDERAMWVFGYWLGLLCRFERVWWIRARSANDYRAICAWLDQRRVRRRVGEDGLMWTALMDDLERAPLQPFGSMEWQSCMNSC